MYDYHANMLHIQQIPQEGLAITLRPEQILPQSTAPSLKNRNKVIRLAESMRKYGILEPLKVKASGTRDGTPIYSPIGDDKPLFAAIVANITQIPCLLLPDDDRNCAIESIMRNLKQQKLHFFDQANAYQLLIQEFHLTQEEIARRAGASQSTIANKLRLLRFSQEERHKIIDFGLTERHARALLRLKSPAARATLLSQIRAKALNVAATESLIAEHLAKRPSAPTEAAERIEMHPQAPANEQLRPQKFALQSLAPLYNSIERVLGIFQKTGAAVSCYREESETSVRIVIEVPKNAHF